MAATGLDVFDRTLQATNAWLAEIMEHAGLDRAGAWQALGAVLHALRDRVPAELAVHVGAQLPLLVRGLYYDGFSTAHEPDKARSLDAFLERIRFHLEGGRLADPRLAAEAVLRVLARHLDPGQAGKLLRALPQPVQELWRGVAAVSLPEERMEARGGILT